MTKKLSVSRRRFLEIVGVGGGVVALRSLVSPSQAVASEDDPQLLLCVYFSGGWDQLLAFDPRPANDPKYQENNPSKESGKTGIYPAYGMVTDQAVKDLLAANPSGVQKKGNLTFGPAVPDSLTKHYLDLCIVRGLMMDTLTHEVGRRYFTTGKFPRGLAPNGSALGTMVASLQGGATLLPNLAVSVESYNEGQPAYASPIRVNTAGDVLNVLKPIGEQLDPKSDEALKAFEAASDTCEHHGYDGAGLVSLFKASREKARSMVNSETASLFSYNMANKVEPLFSMLDIGVNGDLNGPKGKAAIAALALEHGVSHSVSVQLASDLDDHFDWDTTHATSLRTSFDVLGRLIDYLKQADWQGPGGGKVWARTTMLVFSEFARGPLVNARSGRDHHLASSCVLAGPRIQGNLVVGATTDQDMAFSKMDLSSGLPSESGAIVRPADVHATLLDSMGLGYDHLSNQTPQVIEKVLKA